MRGYTEQGKLVNEAVVAERINALDENEYRAEVRVAGVGTWMGNWLVRRNVAQDELTELKAKHWPFSNPDPESTGISPKQQEDFAAALCKGPECTAPRGTDAHSEACFKLHESANQTARRELGHGFNMAYEG